MIDRTTQARVELVQAFDREAESVEHAGAEVLDQDVAVADEALDELLALGGLQVDGDGLLVAVGCQEVGRDVMIRPDERRAPAARLVTPRPDARL
ncbi:hypothetical protein GCM10020220_048500 [Nonomuraea rubra]